MEDTVPIESPKVFKAKRTHHRSLSGQDVVTDSEHLSSPITTVEDFVAHFGTKGHARVIKKILIANNGIAVSLDT